MQDAGDAVPRLVYLVRLWQVETESGPAWRGTVESPRQAERHRFVDLAGLFTYLTEQTYTQAGVEEEQQIT